MKVKVAICILNEKDEILSKQYVSVGWAKEEKELEAEDEFSSTVASIMVFNLMRKLDVTTVIKLMGDAGIKVKETENEN